jgi:lipoprotein-releasing system permease protein
LRGFDGDLNLPHPLSAEYFSDISEIKVAMPYIERKGVIKGGKDNLIVFIKAIDESLMDDFYEIQLKGNRLKDGHVLIGKGLAKQLGKDINDEITLFSPIDQVNGIGFPPMKKMNISGVFSTKVLNYDDSYVFMTLNDGKNLFKRKKKIDGYDIKVYNQKEIEITKLKLDNLVGDDIIIKSWQEKNKSLVDAMKMERIAAIIILGLIFLVSSFNLSSSLILLSIRKMKEVGMVRVLGAPKKELVTVVVLLGIKTAMKGVLFGFCIALSIIFFQNVFSFIPLPSKIYFIDYLPMKISITDCFLVCIMVSSFVILSSYFAAKKIAYLKLTKALQWAK